MASMKSSKRGITRRDWAAGVAAGIPAAAQQRPASSNPPDELAAAREQWKRTTSALRQFKLPQLVEPSFVFKP